MLDTLLTIYFAGIIPATAYGFYLNRHEKGKVTTMAAGLGWPLILAWILVSWAFTLLLFFIAWVNDRV